MSRHNVDLSRRTHGLRSTYTDGCHCRDCTDADREYHRARYAATRIEHPNVVELDASWMRHAVCTGVDPDLFFPARGSNHDWTAARAVCAICPVAAECLTYALDANERYGMWGGKSERERRAMRRVRRVTMEAS